MKTIILSAGHGGSDPGAVGNGLRESDLNLAITLACRDHLNKHYTGHRLILPRDRDVYVSLPARRTMAINEKADFYLSMHNNAFTNPSARGFETFTHSGPLFETTLNHQKVMHNTVYDYLRDYGVPNRGAKRFNHWVTREMPCPTVLMEYLFVTSPTDAALMKRPGFLQQLGAVTAEGVAEALSLPLKQEPAPPSNIWWRAVAGSYRDRAIAERMVAQLRAQGIGAFLEAKHD